MLHKMMLRGITPELRSTLSELAERNSRSLEGEIRVALRAWTEPFLNNKKQSVRCREVADRLHKALDLATNFRWSGKSFTASHIAERIGETHAGSIEESLAGEKELSFALLRKIADDLGVSGEWLVHAQGVPYPLERFELPERGDRAFVTLFDLSEEKHSRLKRLMLIRAEGERGLVCLLLIYEDGRSRMRHPTNLHISNFNGSTGEHTLRAFGGALRLLYSVYRNKPFPGVLTSHVMRQDDFMRLVSGEVNPAAETADLDNEPWWEDLWDKREVPETSRREYWPGYGDHRRLVLDLLQAEEAHN